MDDATINRMVMERLGLKDVQCDDVDEDGTILVWIELLDAAGKKYRPNFATSLDAMAQAEATMTLLERTNYINELLPDIDTYIQYADEWLLLTVPARTRAMAFLAATKNRSVSNE